MTRFSAVAAVALIGMIWSPVLHAQDSQKKGKTESQAGSQEVDDDPIVCKTIRVTGSRLGTQRVCKRRSQIEAEHAERARDINKATQSKSCSPAQPC